MRPFLIPVALLSTTVSSQLVVPFLQDAPMLRRFLPFLDRNQVPLMDPAGPGPAMPPSAPGESPSDSKGGGGVRLSDVMGRDRSMNLFAGFVRDIESASRRLEDSSQNTTVLAPLNTAIEKLPRKPWEDPRDYGALGPDAYEGGEGQERAQRNLRRFVEAHLVPESPWPEGEKKRPIGGDMEIWWEEKDGTRVIQPGGIEVHSFGGAVTNGEVWIIKAVRNYA